MLSGPSTVQNLAYVYESNCRELGKVAVVLTKIVTEDGDIPWALGLHGIGMS